MPHYYLGRQAIFDANVKVIGYELLYRSMTSGPCTGVNGDEATSQVLLNSFIEMGLARVVGDHRAFVNLTRNFVLNHELLPPANDQLVLEILEDIPIDEELIAAIKALKEKGYVIALDDFAYDEKLHPLIDLADIVKLDLQTMDRSMVTEHFRSLRRFPVKLLAEKVETPAEFDWCKELGFDYYQGFFLSRPRVLQGRRLPENRLNSLRMMAKLHDPDLDIAELDDVISQDVTLSYKLLRYINSAAFPVNKEIESVRHAIVYLGEDEIRRWASLVALANVDDKPGELIMTSLTRSKMCELLADHLGRGNTRTAFLIGLFSTIDAMMDAQLADLLEPLPVTREVTEALLQGQGKYHEILQCAPASARRDWDHVRCAGLPQETIAEIYMEAIEWAEVAIHNLGDRR